MTGRETQTVQPRRPTSRYKRRSYNVRPGLESPGRSPKLDYAKIERSSPALPAQPETPNDGHLAGLLTYASANFERLPGIFSPIHANIRRDWGISSGMLLKFSANTVAGQWRILTALPINQMEESYMTERERSSRLVIG